MERKTKNSLDIYFTIEITILLNRFLPVLLKYGDVGDVKQIENKYLF